VGFVVGKLMLPFVVAEAIHVFLKVRFCKKNAGAVRAFEIMIAVTFFSHFISLCIFQVSSAYFLGECVFRAKST
jgi:hypothetical protein